MNAAALLKGPLVRVRHLIQIVLVNNIPLRYMFSVEFPHPLGIVIADECRIGRHVVIYQHVTLGRKDINTIGRVPVIHDGVIIYPGSVVIGAVSVGANSVIGAHSLIDKDVPEGVIVVGHNRILSRVTNEAAT